jgi:GNAT superfamily N-acetyltransferase
VSSGSLLVRTAGPNDVADICQFGTAHVRAHYAPLIGAPAADEQVHRWWNEAYLSTAVRDGLVVVAELDGELVGVGQRGRRGTDHVIYKLYVHPEHRGRGVGPQLIDALVQQLPADVDRLYVEHFAANGRAGAFYERQGFAVQHVEKGAGGDPAMDVVWRVRELARAAR